MAFSDDAILEGTTPWERSLEGQTGAAIHRKTKLASADIPIEEAAPMEELAPAKVPTEEVAPIEEPTKKTAPMEKPTEEPAAMKAPASKPAGEPDIPPVQLGDKGKGKVPPSDFPGWMEVLHPAQSVTSAGEIPPPPRELRQRHCSQSVGEGDPDIREQKSADKLSKKDQVWNHHQGPLNLGPRLYHCWASRELQPAY